MTDTTTAGTTWTLTIPAPAPWINANDRMHWAPKSKLTKAWRQVARIRAQQANLPRGLPTCQIVASIHKTHNRKYDSGNLFPTLKAVVDGLIDYGLCADDDNEHVTGPFLIAGAKANRPSVTLTITTEDTLTKCV